MPAPYELPTNDALNTAETKGEDDEPICEHYEQL